MILAPAAMANEPDPKKAAQKCFDEVGLDPDMYRIGHTKIQNSVRQCHQRALRPAKGDPTDSGRDQSGARVVSYGQYQGIGRLWFVVKRRGCCTLYYPSSKTFDPSTFFLFQFFFFLF